MKYLLLAFAVLGCVPTTPRRVECRIVPRACVMPCTGMCWVVECTGLPETEACFPAEGG